MYDILIIGAGVIGCSIARELSRYKLKTAVIEKCPDVSRGTSMANSAIVHAGYDAKPGTLKAKMNIAGNPMFDALAKELDFPFKRIGSLILCFGPEDMPELEKLKSRGEKNGVSGLEILDREQLLKKEPNIAPGVYAALWAPTGGIVCPYEMTIALAENAAENGVEFLLNHNVTDIALENGCFVIGTSQGKISGKILINAAGLFSDDIHNMLSSEQITIAPRAGQYLLLDKTAGHLANHTLFQLPTAMGKGILVTPTVDGNLLLGPTAVNVESKTNVSTSGPHYEEITNTANLSINNLPVRQAITAFTGLRAHSLSDDFIIGHTNDVPNMIDVAGIESPGLTSAPAIGIAVAELVGELTELEPNPSFNPKRESIPKFREMSMAERNKMIALNPAYGRIVCRCETVSEGEIIAAIKRPLGARDIDSVKRRTRAGMGRCQGGFCSPHIAEILSRELDVPMTEITKSGPGSHILIGRNKEI